MRIKNIYIFLSKPFLEFHAKSYGNGGFSNIYVKLIKINKVQTIIFFNK